MENTVTKNSKAVVPAKQGLEETLQYMQDISQAIAEGNAEKAIKFLNRKELTPMVIGRHLLGRDVETDEQPYFFNQCPEYAPDSCRREASIARRMRDCHQTARRVIRELKETGRITESTKRVSTEYSDIAELLREYI